VSQKNCTPKAGRHKFCYFPNTKKIRNIRFVGNFILNKSCEFYYDDITMTSFEAINKATSPPNMLHNEQHVSAKVSGCHGNLAAGTRPVLNFSSSINPQLNGDALCEKSLWANLF